MLVGGKNTKPPPSGSVRLRPVFIYTKMRACARMWRASFNHVSCRPQAGLLATLPGLDEAW